MLKIAAVEYINTLPFLRGLELGFSSDEFQLFTAHPAACANLFYDNKVDVALVPVGTLDVLPPHEIITDYCIGSDGPVDTVAILSNEPLEELDAIALDDHSRTSAKLVKYLVRDYWGLESIQFVPESHEDGPRIGRLYIGDKVKEKEVFYSQKYDLGTAWSDWAGCPMVFAVWVAKPSVTAEEINSLNHAFRKSFDDFEALDLSMYKNSAFWRHYLKNNIRFKFDQAARQGLKRFLSMNG